MKYESNGFRAVTADSMSDAARVFAGRQARKEYGRAGYVRICNLESWSQNGTLGEFNAFIGYTPPGKHNRGITTGRNFRFTVRGTLQDEARAKAKGGVA